MTTYQVKGFEGINEIHLQTTDGFFNPETCDTAYLPEAKTFFENCKPSSIRQGELVLIELLEIDEDGNIKQVEHKII